ncbi:MAG: holo-ACP synthase [Firmicutes bacterium]|jgi:holo-[acyl-carrier protein] synthase|nr:holo-ACP synthase [Bacillota bacterium]
MACEHVLGVGVDIIEIRRFRRIAAMAPSGVARRLYTDEELLDERIDRPEYLASRFAAKEAVMKALGRGMGSIAFTDIEIFQDEYGRPQARLIGSARARADSIGVRTVMLSLSHSDEMVCAFAVSIGGVCDEASNSG